MFLSEWIGLGAQYGVAISPSWPLSTQRALAVLALPNYFIDAVNGSDSNPGTSAVEPWQTPAPLLAQTSGFFTGKKIGFAAGGSYAPFDLAVLLADRCSLVSYGAGAPPKFDCTAPVVGSWTNVGGGVWSIPLARSANAKMFGNYLQNGVPTRKVATQGALAGKANFTSFIQNEQTATPTWFMNAPADPTTDGNAYTFSKYGVGVAVQGNANSVIGLWGVGPAYEDGVFALYSPSSGATAGHYLGYCRGDWGTRHLMLVGSAPTGQSIAEYNQFNGGANDIDPSGTLSNGAANSLIFNSADHTNFTAISRYNTYNGMGYPNYNGAVASNFTGPYAHDGTAGRLCKSFQSIGDTYIDCEQGPEASGLTSILTDGTYTRVIQGFEIGGSTPSPPTITWARNSGTLNQLTNATGAFTGTETDCHYTINNIGNGVGQFFLVANAIGTPIAWKTKRCTYDVEGVAATIIANARLFSVTYGTLEFGNGAGESGNGNTVGPALCDSLTNIFFGANLTVTGDANTYPAWFQSITLGMTYTSLVAWQATGADATSVNAAPPAATLSDSFAGASGSLDVRAPWTRLSGTTFPGVANAMTLGNGVVNATSAALTAYEIGNTPTQDHYAQTIVKGVNATAGAGIAICMINNDNVIWLRWNTTAYQAEQSLAGALTQIATAAATPAVNDNVLICRRSVVDPVTSATLQVVLAIVNGSKLFRFSGAIPGLSAATGVGLVNRGTAQAPQVGAVTYGPAR